MHVPHPRADRVFDRGVIRARGDFATHNGDHQRVLMPEVVVLVLPHLDTPRLLVKLFDLRGVKLSIQAMYTKSWENAISHPCSMHQPQAEHSPWGT